jgi:hypothetical protein
VLPDRSEELVSVDVFYTQQGQIEGEKNDHKNTIARFWRHAVASKKGDRWIAKLPLFSSDQPLWVYANVMYSLDQPISGAGYYYRDYTAKQFNLSSLTAMVTPKELNAAGVKATLEPSRLVETFVGDWEKEWFTYRPEEWARSTHKLYDPQWAAQANGTLAVEVRSEKPNSLVVRIDDFAAEASLRGGNGWQQVELTLTDFLNALGESRQDWGGIMELRLGAKETIRSRKKGEEKRRTVGADWVGAKPEFRSLQWIVK